MASSQPLSYSVEAIIKMIESVRSFVEKSAEIINKHPYQPLLNSRVLIEANKFANKELVEDVFSRATLCFENAADHLLAFTDTLQQPAKTLSPYTCLRSFLESCAIALWLLDLNIDVKERIGRCFGYRYKEFKEQIKFFEADKTDPHEAQTQVNSVKQRLAVVEAEAIDLGYPKYPSKSGIATGIAIRVPGIVDLIKMTLDKEAEYRLLSGVAHSYLWATRQIGFQVIDVTDADGLKFKAVKKHAHPDAILFGITLAVPTYAKVFWVVGKQYGWDMQEIEGLLNQIFDDIGFPGNFRFWCQQ
jgi:hypothetical protein